MQGRDTAELAHPKGPGKTHDLTSDSLYQPTIVPENTTARPKIVRIFMTPPLEILSPLEPENALSEGAETLIFHR